MSRLLSVVAILLTAACTQLPEKPAPPKPPAPERAQYIATSFAALPGWERTRLEPSLRAFLRGCARAAAILLGPSGTAPTIPRGGEAAPRSFFAANSNTFALASPDTGDSVTAAG